METGLWLYLNSQDDCLAGRGWAKQAGRDAVREGLQQTSGQACRQTGRGKTGMQGDGQVCRQEGRETGRSSIYKNNFCVDGVLYYFTLEVSQLEWDGWIRGNWGSLKLKWFGTSYSNPGHAEVISLKGGCVKGQSSLKLHNCYFGGIVIALYVGWKITFTYSILPSFFCWLRAFVYVCVCVCVCVCASAFVMSGVDNSLEEFM